MIKYDLDLHIGVENYDRIVRIFKTAVDNYDNYDIIYCDYLGNLTELSNLCTSDLTDEKLGFCIGFDKTSPKIAVLPVKQNLLCYGKPLYLNAKDISLIEISRFRKILKIYSPLFDSKPIELHMASRIGNTKKTPFLPIMQTTYVNSFYSYLKNSELVTRFLI